MVVKLIFLFVVLLSFDASVADDVVSLPKKFTRSRYSHRRSTTTTTELPTTNYDNSVDMVTDVFSEELLPNKVEESVTNNPFDSNDTATTVPTTLMDESLSASTNSHLVEALTEKEVETSTEKELEKVTEKEVENVTTEKEVTNSTEKGVEEQGIFPCGEKNADNHPWIAVLVHTDPNEKSRKKTLSKGVLIDRRHVLTTVSSLHNSRPFWIVSRVRLGDPSVLGGGESEVNRSSTIHVGIEEIFQHKNRDIALIKLAENVNFTNFIRPICLPDTDQYNFTELYLHMCKKEVKSTVVSTVTTTPLSPQDCEIMFKRKRATITAEEFCAWDEAGDSCTGDLGGPLTVIDNGRYSVIGLNSHINSRVKFSYNDYPGIYVRVGSYLSWIRKITGLSN